MGKLNKAQAKHLRWLEAANSELIVSLLDRVIDSVESDGDLALTLSVVARDLMAADIVAQIYESILTRDEDGMFDFDEVLMDIATGSFDTVGRTTEYVLANLSASTLVIGQISTTREMV